VQTHKPTNGLGDRSVRKVLTLYYTDSEQSAKNYKLNHNFQTYYTVN